MKLNALVWELFSHELTFCRWETQPRLLRDFGRELRRAAELATV